MEIFTHGGRTYAVDSGGRLSPREETEVAAVLCGQTHKESAKVRGVSPDTAKAQRASARAKLNARSVSELALGLIRQGWLLAFHRGVLRCATQIARLHVHLAHGRAERFTDSDVPVFTFSAPALSVRRMTPRQRTHARSLSSANRERYSRYLASRAEALTALGGQP